MDFQCYQILIVTADGEAIILEEDGIIELVSDFSFADSMDELFELIKNLFPDLEELSDAQFDFFKRLAEIKDLSELIKIEASVNFYSDYPDADSVFDEETGLYVSTDKVNYNFADKSYHYGYMKDPNNPKQYIPDPETAPIVKRIFEMYASGIGIVKICDRLSAEKIICPSVYAFRKNGNKSGNPDLSKPYHWAQNTVRKMLSNQEYVGDTVNFKTYSKSNKLKKRLKNDPENILILKDTHEAIIDRKTFEMVQRHFAGRKRPDKQGEMDKYAGFLFCGECGKRLYLHRGKTVKPENNAFQCGGFQRRTTECTAHYIRESVLDAIVLHNLQTVTAFARDNPDEFYAMATQNGEEEAEKFYRNASIQKEQLEKRIQDLDNIIRCLYEDRVSGRITPERYDSMANGYEREQAEKKRELQELAARIGEVDMRDQCIQEFIRNAKQYIEMPKLTPELLRVFIRRIEVYEKFEKYSRTAGNPIRIHYAFRLPEQEGIPAIEVLTQPTAKTA